MSLRNPMRRGPRIVIAGSRGLPAESAEPLLSFLATCVPDPVVVMRRGISSDPGPLEQEVSRVCQRLRIRVDWKIPEPGGRDQVFHRDIEMLRGADLALVMFSAEKMMEGGTAHVVEKAQDARVPVYAYKWESGMIHRVGEFDPDDEWGAYVPGAN